MEVGSGVGYEVGMLVGMDVGAGVGTEVGYEVGMDVGIEVGNSVDGWLGLDLGLLVGLMVGAVLGSGVGTAVSSSRCEAAPRCLLCAIVFAVAKLAVTSRADPCVLHEPKNFLSMALFSSRTTLLVPQMVTLRMDDSVPLRSPSGINEWSVSMNDCS
jgi:hypothetical protein